MALVILPSDHRDADLSLASLIAMELELEELHVFVNVDPAARVTEPRPEGEAGSSGTFAGLLAAVDGLLERLADALTPRSGDQPKTGKQRRRASRSTPDCNTDTTSRSLRST